MMASSGVMGSTPGDRQPLQTAKNSSTPARLAESASGSGRLHHARRRARRASSFAGRAKFSTWFYRILVNLCLDHRRKVRGWRLWLRDEPDPDSGESLLDRQPAPFADPVDALGRERTLTKVWAAVDRLAPQQRAAVILQVQEELTTPEIAAVLKCSEATVRVHLHRALRTLKKTMETS